MATHAPRLGSLGLARPVRAAGPLLALALVALALGAAPQLRVAGLVGGGCFLLAAAVRAGHARAELRRVRRTADRLILADAEAAQGSDIVRWRVGELVAPTVRERLATELDLTLRRLDPARLPAASPLRRGVARTHAEQLGRLRERMLDGRPVTARGVLLLQRLLREPGSPLYDDATERGLSRAIAAIVMELEP